MHGRTRRGNRLGLALLGALLVLGGTAAILAHTGVLGRRVAEAAVYPAAANDWIVAHRWIYWVVAGVAVVLGLLALRWLLVQLRSDRIAEVRIDTDRDSSTDAGLTALVAGALGDAVAHDAGRIEGVRSSRAAVTGGRDAPELRLTVTLDADADAGAVREQLTGVVRHARASLDRPDLPVWLTLDVSRRPSTRSVV